MKKFLLIIATCTSIFFACKKEDKTTEPTPVSPTNPACATCPYCIIDTAVVDTLPHMIATIDDSIHFVASEIRDTLFYSGPHVYDSIVGKNTFAIGVPEISIIRMGGFTTGPFTYIVNDTLSGVSIHLIYKINGKSFHSKKGIIHDKSWKTKSMPPTYYNYVSEYTAFFCFNTDTIDGVSHKIKLGSIKLKKS